MHDEPRSDLESRAFDAFAAAEPPPGFADRVLAAQRARERTVEPPIAPARLFPALGLRVAGLLVAAVAAAGAAFAAANWLSSRPGPERPVPTDTSKLAPRAEAPVSAALPPAPADGAPAVELPADLAERIDRYVAGFGARYGDAFKFHGVVGVLKDGEPVFMRGYGLADPKTDAPNGPDTRFKIGSLTQTFTAVAVLQLRDRGLVDLDAPVRKYLPDYPPIGQKITLRHLLSHTSGIPSYTDTQVFALGHDGPVAAADVRALFQDLPLEFAPGTDFDLSNSGYFLLGQVVEAVSGKPLADVLATDVLAPAGMKRSGLGIAVDAVGQEFDEDEVLVPAAQRHPSAYGGAAALVSTAADLARWDRALRTPGLVLSQKSLAEMTTEVREEYGLGWFLRRDHDQTMAFYPGGVEGYNATITRYLDDGVTVFALANTEAIDTRPLVYDIAQIAHGEAVEPPPEHVEVPIAPAEFARYTGAYALSETTRAELGKLIDREELEALERVRVFRINGRLFMYVPDHGDKWMHAAGGDRFFFKDPGGTTAEFGPPGAPVAHLTLTQGELRFILRREAARPHEGRPVPSVGLGPRNSP